MNQHQLIRSPHEPSYFPSIKINRNDKKLLARKQISSAGDCLLCEQDSCSTHCGWGRASGVVGDDDGYHYDNYYLRIDCTDDNCNDDNCNDDDDDGTGGSVEDPATSVWERTEGEAETSMRFSSSSISSSFPSEIANVWRFSSMLYPILFLSSSKIAKVFTFFRHELEDLEVEVVAAMGAEGEVDILAEGQ